MRAPGLTLGDTLGTGWQGIGSALSFIGQSALKAPGGVTVVWHRLRRIVVLAMLAIVALTMPAVRGPADLEWRLASVATPDSFNLWKWEVQTLSNRWTQAVFKPVAPAGPAEVLEYFKLAHETDQARQARDTQWARQAVNGSAPGLAAAQARVDNLNRQLQQLQPMVEATIGSEIEAEQRRQGLDPATITWQVRDHLPFLVPNITPSVFFQLGPLPDVLVVAPRDRIELTASVLVQPGLSTTQLDNLEQSADNLGVSSVVTDIGGLSAYPTMLPDTSSGAEVLVTVAHEWTHHYLALRPLGMAYWKSYSMLEINETVADMVGHEVGEAVYQDSYAPLIPSAPDVPVSDVTTAPAPPDFGTLMRHIRTTVEGYLARHDVDGADAYMTQQQKELAQDGYYVRKLNTAYLSFFGSYAGGANPYEPKLRALRSRMPSVAAFLEVVSQIQQPSDLDRLLANPPNA